MTRHILGMAKSSLDMIGSKPRNLELDFLRLIYAVEHFRASGNAAHGYLLVMDERIARRIHGWVAKYNAQDCVTVVVANLSAETRATLEAEKDNNRNGNKPGRDRNLASAVVGKRFGEESLRDNVLALEPGVIESSTSPMGIKWDFYGTIT